MPTYNRADHIIETIQSIQRQTYTNWELIIIDDGSTDNTDTVIKDIKDQRIIYKRRQHTGVLGKIKNYAVGEVKGELIAFMDSDDLWPEDKLEKQVKVLLEHPEAGFSLTNGYNFKDSPGKPFELFYQKTSGVEEKYGFIEFCLGRISGFTQVLMVWKKNIQDMAFSEDRPCSDMSFVGRLSYKFKVVILYEPLLMRRLHEQSMTQNDKIDFNSEYSDMILEFRKEKKLPAHIADKAMFKNHINFGERCMEQKKLYPAINNFVTAWKYQPYSIIPVKKIAKAIFYYFKK